jgi:hypothetical protein
MLVSYFDSTVGDKVKNIPEGHVRWTEVAY